MTTTAPPPAVARLLARIQREDGRYLRAHPDADSYTRPYVPGECWPAEPLHCFSKVRVVRTELGTVMRIFLPADPEA